MSAPDSEERKFGLTKKKFAILLAFGDLDERKMQARRLK